jgi:hypothetical protein
METLEHFKNIILKEMIKLRVYQKIKNETICEKVKLSFR